MAGSLYFMQQASFRMQGERNPDGDANSDTKLHYSLLILNAQKLV